MFGKNKILGKAAFKNIKDALHVTSIFVTIQGEGPYSGMPAVFVRLSGCNLACSFCDTYFDSGNLMTYAEVEAKIDEAIFTYFEGNVPKFASYSTHTENGYEEVWRKRRMVLVVTGGEPALQPNILGFLENMMYKFEYTQIESNGTIQVEIPYQTTLVVSPKCMEVKGVATRYLKPNKDVIERADALKFVISADENSAYHTIPDWALELDEQLPIYVSPINVYNDEPKKSKEIRAFGGDVLFSDRSTVDEVISFWEPDLLNREINQRNHEYTARYALKNGLLLSLQTHLYAGLA